MCLNAPYPLSVLALAVALAGVPAAVAAAPVADAEAVADEAQVTDSAQADEAVEHLLVVGSGYRSTATKSSLTAFEAPMSVSVIDQELLAMRQADSVNAALRYVSGITPESRSTVTIFDQYTIRGFESYRNYYDGLPLQANGLWNLYPQVDAFATDSIEVVKGPTSVLYGSAPPGGMVNQIAKQPTAVAATTLRARTGSNALAELALDSTGPLAGDDLNYRVIALGRDQDGQQQTTEEQRLLFAPSLAWQPTARTSLITSLYYQRDPQMIPSTPLPALGTLYPASYGELEADAYAGDQNWNSYDRDVLMAGYKLSHQLTSDWSLLQNFRYTDAEALQRNMYNNGLASDGRTLLRSAYFTDEAMDGWVIDNQLAGNLRLLASDHRLLLGIDYQTLDSTVAYGDTLGTDTPAIDLANPDYRQVDAAALPVDYYSEQHRIKQRQLGFYLQDEVAIGQLTLVAGLRHDRYDSSDDVANVYAGFPYGSQTEIDQSETSGRLAAIYALPFGLSPYLNYSESFEPTSGVDSLTGAAFKPTTAKQYEAGLKYQRDGVQLTAAWFDLIKQNVVVNSADYMRYTQTGEIESKGLELEGRADLGAHLELIANYSYLDMAITDNDLDPALVGNTPVWVADQQASLWANYYLDALLPGVMVGAGWRYVGDSYLDAANSDSVPGYSLIDVAASYAISDSYLLGLSVSNLSDKRYVGACWDASNCWMGAERSMELSLTASF